MIDGAVDNREVRARMDFPTTRLLLERGCDKDIIRALIEERLRERKDFETATDLMLAYMARSPTLSSLSSKPASSHGGRGSSFDAKEFQDVRQKTGPRRYAM